MTEITLSRFARSLKLAGAAAALAAGVIGAYDIGSMLGAPPVLAAERLQDIPNLPPEMKRQAAALDVHKDELNNLSALIAAVDTAVVCNVKGAEWGTTYRTKLWHMYDVLAAGYGFSEQTKYVVHQDVETHAQNFSQKIPCDKINSEIVDQLAGIIR